MLFKQSVLERIAIGEITLAFRRWRQPSVKAGGTLLTPIGQLAIEEVAAISPSQITSRDARQAGFGDVDALVGELVRRSAGTFYRIRFRLMGADPRIELRDQNKLSVADAAEIVTRLERLDQRSANGVWTRTVLDLIAEHPERRVAELAAMSRFDKEWLKLHVRKLKNLGLTESLNPGYRLSPRGQALLTRLRKTSR